jgi:UDP-N-acetylglucosamine--N-acetylmuramyl-(pentapeptide) pyrophosphoryl-undecaprenol N-acetylglucosamine transferase
VDELRVLVASGDSVGHLSHAAVILDALAEHHQVNSRVVLPHDARFRPWIEQRGFVVEPVGTGIGENREFGAGDLVRHARALSTSTFRGFREAGTLLDRFRPHLVIGTGGRCSFAPMLAAAARRLPTVTVPHYALRRANHALAYVVDRTCLAREADLRRFPAFVRKRLRVTGTPLRPEAFAPASPWGARKRLGLDPHRPVLALIGYSGGSAGTTRLFADTVRHLRRARPDVQLVVQYGQHAPQGEDVGMLERSALAQPFFDDLLSVFAACDLAVTAAGETTLLELCARGVPAICLSVPDTPIGPHIRVLTADLRARGAIAPAEETDLTGHGLMESVIGLLTDEQGRLRMAEAARAFVDPHATSAILEVIEEILKGRGRGAPSDAGSLAG